MGRGVEMKKFKLEIFFVVLFMVLTAALFVAMTVKVFTVGSDIQQLENNHRKLILATGCDIYCRDEGEGILMFAAPDYCLPKKFLGIKYSEVCTPLTQCRCRQTRFYFECKMVTEVRKVCTSERGVERETILE